MIAFAVIAKAGQTLAVFRREGDAHAYKAAHAHHREPVFQAVGIVKGIYPEPMWHHGFVPLTERRKVRADA